MISPSTSRGFGLLNLAPSIRPRHAQRPIALAARLKKVRPRETISDGRGIDRTYWQAKRGMIDSSRNAAAASHAFTRDDLTGALPHNSPAWTGRNGRRVRSG